MNPWPKIKTFDEFKKVFFNTVVYQPYSPQRVGKIVSLRQRTSTFDPYDVIAKIKWMKQTEKYPDKYTYEKTAHLQIYSALVDDHHQKYLKHKAILKQAQKL